MIEIHQTFPYPTDLVGLVADVKYRPGWRFKLYDSDRGQGCAGLTLDILASTIDAYNPTSGPYERHHKIAIPAVNWDRDGWALWLYEQCLAVETHECREFFRVRGVRMFAPPHGFRSQPYAGVVDG